MQLLLADEQQGVWSTTWYGATFSSQPYCVLCLRHVSRVAGAGDSRRDCVFGV